jgi:ribosomal protein S18 acetylase RimI-like enzyme
MDQRNPFQHLPDAPAIPGLTFRLFQGEADILALKALRQEIEAIDGNTWFPGPDTVSAPTCNPLQDCLLAEVDHKLIGSTWLTWWTENGGTQLYLHLGWITPAWRRKGIGRAILRWQELRLREIAKTQQLAAGSRIFGANADEGQSDNRALLLSEGYQVAFTLVEMRCQIPEAPLQVTPLPDGLVIRPVEETQLPAIYAANDEAFQESQTGHIRHSYDDFLRDLHWPQADTSFWFIAWDGDQVAGLVISEIDDEGGHTLWVAVRRPWRQRGLAQALMTRSIQHFQERGVKQARLFTMMENRWRSVHLYESVGYQIVKRYPRYRKPIELV